jgi:hypothetical protein
MFNSFTIEDTRHLCQIRRSFPKFPIVLGTHQNFYLLCPKFRQIPKLIALNQVKMETWASLFLLKLTHDGSVKNNWRYWRWEFMYVDSAMQISFQVSLIVSLLDCCRTVFYRRKVDMASEYFEDHQKNIMRNMQAKLLILGYLNWINYSMKK